MNYKKVKSTHIDEIGHDPDKNELFIKFSTGSVYVYENVTPTDHKKLMNSKSKGIHLNTHIVPKSKFKVKSWGKKKS